MDLKIKKGNRACKNKSKVGVNSVLIGFLALLRNNEFTGCKGLLRKHREDKVKVDK